MLTYRNYGTFQEKQTDPDPEKIDDFKASSYLNYQGDKLVKRFNAYSYWLLTKAMDSHHLGRGRGGDLIKVLHSIFQPTLIIGIHSDILCPLDEQKFMSDHIPNAKLIEINSKLLIWKENDRAIATFKNLQDIDNGKAELINIVKEWINATK